MPSKAIFEPPIIQNKQTQQEVFHVADVQPKAERQEEIVKRLEYPAHLKNATESQSQVIIPYLIHHYKSKVSQNIIMSSLGATSREELTEKENQEQFSSLQELVPQDKSLKRVSHQELSVIEKEVLSYIFKKKLIKFSARRKREKTRRKRI